MWIDKVLDYIGLVRKSQVKVEITSSKPIIENDISAEDKRENTILLKSNDIYSLCHRCIELLKQNKNRYTTFKLENSRLHGTTGYVYLGGFSDYNVSINFDEEDNCERVWDKLTKDIEYFKSRDNGSGSGK